MKSSLFVLVFIVPGLLEAKAFIFSNPEPEVRIKLYKGNHTSGVVLINVNQVWGTICDDMWDDNDARVVCRQLGFDLESHINRAPERFNIRLYADELREKPIMLTDVSCQGHEDDFFQCPHRNATVRCDHDEDAGVICRLPTPTETETPKTETTTTPTTTTTTTTPSTTTTAGQWWLAGWIDNSPDSEEYDSEEDEWHVDYVSPKVEFQDEGINPDERYPYDVDTDKGSVTPTTRGQPGPPYLTSGGARPLVDAIVCLFVFFCRSVL